jgi:4-hydroxyphenylacetate 3-monooxygenase
VQAQLGDLAARVSLVEGLIIAAEDKAFLDEFGVMRPNPAMVYANHTLQAAMYPELLTTIRGMMGGSVIQVPSSEAELMNPETAPDFERYVRWPETPALDRIKLLKLLWDVIGSEFGSRHMQYEMFYAGEPAVVKSREYRSFDWAGAQRLVDDCLDSYGVGTATDGSARPQSESLPSRG